MEFGGCGDLVNGVLGLVMGIRRAPPPVFGELARAVERVRALNSFPALRARKTVPSQYNCSKYYASQVTAQKSWVRLITYT